MALPVLKCPFLSQLTLQQVRASAPHILNAGIESCPIFSQFARKISTSTISDTSNLSSMPRPLSMDEIKAIHEKVYEKRNEENSSSKVKTTLQTSLNTRIPNPYGEIIISSECEDLLCPFLKSTPITLRRVNMDQDTIEVNRKLGKATRPTSLPPKVDIANSFEYDQFFDEKIEAKKRDNSYRVFKRVQRKSGCFPKAEEQKHLDDDSESRTITVWCSNDYLGLGQHPKLKKAVIDAVTAHGSGSGGTRNISGTSPLHEKLEEKLARLHQKESALIFTSCYVANDTTLFTLAKALPNCHILSDSGNHASMIQGIRNSQVPKHIFRHNDIDHLEELLKKIPRHLPKIVAFETVHSMDGSICDLEAMLDVAHAYGSLTFIDEVHAVGLYGHNGAGIGERDHVLHKMDIISGTLGKAFGSIGGYIAGNAKMTDFIRSYGSGFIFTTSMPPTIVASASAAIDISMSDEGRSLRRKQQENVRELRSKLIDAGLPVMMSPSHIIPIHVGNAALATLLCNHLLDRYSIYLQSINYPTVERGTERLRIAATPYHTNEMIDQLVDALKQVWKDVGLSLKGVEQQHQQQFVALRQHA
jgi:5-aminolevulinate synthase